MRRAAKLIIAVVVAPVIGTFALILYLLVWGYSEFPGDVSAPDVASVPVPVIAGLDRHLGHGADWYAARLFLQRDKRVMPQRTYNVAGTTSRLWIATFWSRPERIAEIAQQAYFGHGFFGVKSAAQGYFGRPSASLSEEEIAALALLTRAPSRYSPWCHREVFAEGVSGTPSFSSIAVHEMLKNLLPPPSEACEPAG